MRLKVERTFGRSLSLSSALPHPAMIVRNLTALSFASLAVCTTLPLVAPFSIAQEGSALSQEGEAESEAQEPLDARTLRQLELAAAFFEVADYNADGWITFREARQSLELDRTRFHVFDADGDGLISLDEFSEQYKKTVRQIGAFKPPIPNPDDPNAPNVLDLLAEEVDSEEAEVVPMDTPLPACTVLELFGEVIPRGTSAISSPEPDRIVGPVASFRRVDYNNDGGITNADLTELSRGSGLDIRINTILATIDLDADGKVSEEEFYASMRHSN